MSRVSGSTASSGEAHRDGPSPGRRWWREPLATNAAGPAGRVAEWLFLLTFAVYGYFYAGAGWNQNSQFDLTRAIVERHSFAIDDMAQNTGDVARHGGHVYTNKSPGLSWIAALPYAVMYAVARAPSPGATRQPSTPP